MIHKGIVQMDPTKLEMLDDFEKTESGHKYSPPNSNIRIMVTGRDWSEKRLLIYGSSSTEEAEEHFNGLIERVRQIGHTADPVDDLEISNIAVNGDFGQSLLLEEILTTLENNDFEVEYEPEQFPGLIVELGEFGATFLLFSTGKFGIQGLDDREKIEPAIESIQDYISNDE